MWDVAVIGAGLSGLSCAQELSAAGLQVCILDKSRGLGGRMATRRVTPGGERSQAEQPQAPQIRVDHGLRYWQPRSQSLKSLTAELLSAGVIHPWPVSAYEILQREVLTPIELTEPLYGAAMGMSAIARHLSAGFTLEDNLLTGHRAVNLAHAGDHWKITCENGAVTFAKRCAIAIPAAQAADLLATALSSAAPDISGAIKQLNTVSYHPCITVLAGYEPQQANDMGELNPNGWMVTDKVGTSTDWVGLDSSKRNGKNPASSGPVIVIHSKPDFAQQYINAGDLQPAASVLLRASARKIKDWVARPNWFQIHRWRYAQIDRGHPEAALSVVPSLVCGGDWCTPLKTEGSGTESTGTLENIDRAYLSGLAMAKALQNKGPTE
ncbi:MAG: FAD-dependent oxidoreductase [Cyanobacteria bacterium J06598_3]